VVSEGSEKTSWEKWYRTVSGAKRQQTQLAKGNGRKRKLQKNWKDGPDFKSTSNDRKTKSWASCQRVKDVCREKTTTTADQLKRVGESAGTMLVIVESRPENNKRSFKGRKVGMSAGSQKTKMGLGRVLCEKRGGGVSP